MGGMRRGLYIHSVWGKGALFMSFRPLSLPNPYPPNLSDEILSLEIL